MMIARVGCLASMAVLVAMPTIYAAPGEAATKLVSPQALTKFSNPQALQSFSHAVQSGQPLNAPAADRFQLGPSAALAAASLKRDPSAHEAFMPPHARALNRLLAGKTPEALRAPTGAAKALTTPEGSANTHGLDAIGQAARPDVSASPALQGLGLTARANANLLRRPPE